MNRAIYAIAIAGDDKCEGKQTQILKSSWNLFYKCNKRTHTGSNTGIAGLGYRSIWMYIYVPLRCIVLWKRLCIGAMPRLRMHTKSIKGSFILN